MWGVNTGQCFLRHTALCTREQQGHHHIISISVSRLYNIYLQVGRRQEAASAPDRGSASSPHLKTIAGNSRELWRGHLPATCEQLLGWHGASVEAVLHMSHAANRRNGIVLESQRLALISAQLCPAQRAQQAQPPARARPQPPQRSTATPPDHAHRCRCHRRPMADCQRGGTLSACCQGP